MNEASPWREELGSHVGLSRVGGWQEAVNQSAKIREQPRGAKSRPYWKSQSELRKLKEENMFEPVSCLGFKT